jgi:dedicated sortase system histidine kinase
VSIRLQLLVVALTTLVLPWAGCQYARELEGAMRAAQEQALLASAGTIANALSAQPRRVFRETDDARPFDAAVGDVYVFALRSQPLLDGYREDWHVSQEPKPLPAQGGYAARWLVGSTERYLFLYLEVDDPHFNPEPIDVHPETDRFDRVDLLLERPDGALESYFFGTSAQGLIEAQSTVKSEDGRDRAVTEPRIQAYWLQTSRGYHLEARLPLSLTGNRLWIEAIDGASRPTAGPARAGTIEVARPQDLGAGAGERPRGGRLFFPTAGLDELLATFIRPGTRATVLDSNGLKLGQSGSLDPGAASGAGESESAGTWYRRFMPEGTSPPARPALGQGLMQSSPVSRALDGEANAAWLRAGEHQELLLSAAAPIAVGAVTRGAIVLEQTGEELVGLRDRALGRLFNLTLLATGIAVAFVLGFATWISVRIGRLRIAADSAVSPDGQIRLEMPESGRADELGDLSRSFEGLLARLNEHAQYLRTLGGKLSHELRTPLTIVRSSLDNLESEVVRDDQRAYVTRAREGIHRLQSILSSLGAAARVEESIKHTERVNFDLRELLALAVASYRDSFSGVRIELDLPADACFLRGAPDLIAQLLDKLIENAVDFTPASATIEVRLGRVAGRYALEVANDGPPIPELMLPRLFDSLFEHRVGHDERPHFGLGLYIVRLIAEFHGGTASAANRPDGTGAVFTVSLPII